MKPLFLITNDDGYASRGLQHLTAVALEYGDVVVMAPERNASGLSTSISCNRALHVRTISSDPHCRIYACDGTPADCVKMGLEHFCPQPPTMVLSGINYGSNASINIVYSGTMGAVLEACLNGCQAIGFSLLSHKLDSDFAPCTATLRHIIGRVLQTPLPDWTALNVNIPHLPADQIKGVRLCRQSRAAWKDSLDKHFDDQDRPYYMMTGHFVCDDHAVGSDEWALNNGYVSVVPIHPDLTAFEHLTLPLSTDFNSH